MANYRKMATCTCLSSPSLSTLIYLPLWTQNLLGPIADGWAWERYLGGKPQREIWGWNVSPMHQVESFKINWRELWVKIRHSSSYEEFDSSGSMNPLDKVSIICVCVCVCVCVFVSLIHLDHKNFKRSSAPESRRKQGDWGAWRCLCTPA